MLRQLQEQQRNAQAPPQAQYGVAASVPQSSNAHFDLLGLSMPAQSPQMYPPQQSPQIPLYQQQPPTGYPPMQQQPQAIPAQQQYPPAGYGAPQPNPMYSMGQPGQYPGGGYAPQQPMGGLYPQSTPLQAQPMGQSMGQPMGQPPMVGQPMGGQSAYSYPNQLPPNVNANIPPAPNASQIASPRHEYIQNFQAQYPSEFYTTGQPQPEVTQPTQRKSIPSLLQHWSFHEGELLALDGQQQQQQYPQQQQPQYGGMPPQQQPPQYGLPQQQLPTGPPPPVPSFRPN